MRGRRRGGEGGGGATLTRLLEDWVLMGEGMHCEKVEGTK